MQAIAHNKGTIVVDPLTAIWEAMALGHWQNPALNNPKATFLWVSPLHDMLKIKGGRFVRTLLYQSHPQGRKWSAWSALHRGQCYIHASQIPSTASRLRWACDLLAWFGFHTPAGKWTGFWNCCGGLPQPLFAPSLCMEYLGYLKWAPFSDAITSMACTVKDEVGDIMLWDIPSFL